MYTINELQQHTNIKSLAKDTSKLVKAPKVKIDNGNSLTVRDKAIRKIMPKAMDCLGRKINKGDLLDRILGMIEKATKMGGGKADNLIAQLWVVYADIEVNHRQDDHWSLNDIPQPRTLPLLTDRYYVGKDGKAHSKPDVRENVARAVTPHWTGDEGNQTHGNHFYKVPAGFNDNPENDWSIAALLDTDHCVDVDVDTYQPRTWTKADLVAHALTFNRDGKALPIKQS